VIILLNKPYGVLCQFTDSENRPTLVGYVEVKNVYAAGRLDKDSEGLVVLTDDGKLQHRITNPEHKMEKTYWVQVEGNISEDAIEWLKTGVALKDGRTLPAKVNRIEKPENLWQRIPPIRVRKHIPTSWIELTLREGKNRQVKRMTAAVGFPTLRLIRYRIGEWTIENLSCGECKILHR